MFNKGINFIDILPVGDTTFSRRHIGLDPALIVSCRCSVPITIKIFFNCDTVNKDGDANEILDYEISVPADEYIYRSFPSKGENYIIKIVNPNVGLTEEINLKVNTSKIPHFVLV